MDRRLRAAGSVTAQFSQALSSFLLTMLAVRSLDAATFGRLALLLGGTVVATAVMTGIVGDSLTVLDRRAPALRAALQVCCAALAVLVLGAGAAVTWSLGLLSGPDALMFGAALSVFTVEDTVRRLLMASLRFWSVVTVDLAYVLAAGVSLLVSAALGAHLVLHDFVLAVLVGQAFAILVGAALLPGEERALVPWRTAGTAGVAAVLRFGGWRALQQTVRPAALTAVRILVVAAAGSAALGHLETARLYMSPALLLVQGTGGFLLATYATDRHRPIRAAVRDAGRAAGSLVGASILVGLLAAAAVPVLGPLVAGSADVIDRGAVLAWVAYSASVAATMPFASLAAVRGRQVVVVLLRLADTAVGLLVALVLLHVTHRAELVPLALAAGGLLGAGLQRWSVLRAGDGGQRSGGVGTDAGVAVCASP